MECNSIWQRCTFGIWKGLNAVTKLRVSSLLHFVSNPRGACTRQLWLLQNQTDYGKETKWAKGLQKMRFAHTQYLFCFLFFLSNSPLLSSDNRGTVQCEMAVTSGEGRWARQKIEEKKPGLQNFLQYSQHISGYFYFFFVCVCVCV